jgi:hypothetical protein
MTGDADSASSFFELLSFMLTGYRLIWFASQGLRMSRIVWLANCCFPRCNACYVAL